MLLANCDFEELRSESDIKCGIKPRFIRKSLSGCIVIVNHAVIELSLRHFFVNKNFIIVSKKIKESVEIRGVTHSQSVLI